VVQYAWILLTSGCLLVGQQNTTVAAQTAPPDVRRTSQVLRDAINKIKAHKSVSAKLTQDVDLLGYKFKAKGAYHRVGADKVRLEVSFTVRGTGEQLFEHSMLEVCDGKTWWRLFKMPVGIQCTKVDIPQVLKAAAKLKTDPSPNELFVLREFGYGALLPLLEGMEGFADLTLDAQAPPGMWAMSGELSEKMKQRMFDEFRNQNKKLALPPDMPQNCKVLISKKTGWPHKIQMLSEKNRNTGRRYSMVVTFTDVVINKPVDPKLFEFTPDAEYAKQVVDQTPSVVRRLLDMARREAQERERQTADGEQKGAAKPAAPKPGR
jgi:hypothetical protein